MEKSAPVVIVTAAGSGIGGGCARELAERGCRLVLMSPSNNCVELAKEIGAIAMRGSVLETGDLAKLVDLTIRQFGRIDGVLNNTGRDPESTEASGPGYDPDLDRSLIDISDDAWLYGLNLYFFNVVRMARLVTPIFQKQGGGSIVNVSSFAAAEPRLMYPVSSSTRLALAGFTKMYADRYAREGIRMNNILPGFVENWPLEDSLKRHIPSGRAVKIAEIAATAYFLMGDESASITGQSILIDGGVNRSVRA
jgi:NAD(P)-dependent dehydrogenase (short-subunit alcohol dehydrogenase family)